jgi:hypothetical protein
MSDVHPERLTHLVRDALERCHQRGVLLTRWGALQQEPPSSQIYPIASVPHDWLFPQMAVVVAHEVLEPSEPAFAQAFLPSAFRFSPNKLSGEHRSCG